MALKYTATLSSDMILSDLEEHIEWFGQVVRLAFFPNDTEQQNYVEIPSGLVKWCKEEMDTTIIEASTVEQLSILHKELEESAKELLQKIGTNIAATLDEYNAVEHRLIAYTNQLRRLEEDISGVGLDPVTGLRSFSGMKNDVIRELDRRERKGNPFCICNIEIDNVSSLIQQNNQQRLNNIYATVAKLLMKSIRSFDDGYHLGKGEFLLVLKHIDILDACSVMDRMRDEVTKVNITLENSFDELQVTASFGVLEPVPGDQVNDVLENVKKSLRQAQASGGNQVVQWLEQSALQQYASDVSSFD